MPYCIARSNRSERAQIFQNIDFVVDKLHIKDCKKYCHPDNFPAMKPLNSVVCEQKKFWLGRYKYSLKHMSVNRYNFFLFILCNAYNHLNINNQLEYLENHYQKEKYLHFKRNSEQTNDSFNVEEETGYFEPESPSECSQQMNKRSRK